jgi:hypothetical protein
MAEESKNRVALLVALLALGGGLGTWNYQRNLAEERAELRPFRSYSDADLESLTAAYRAEVDAYTTRYEALTGQKPLIRERAHVDQKISEFERVQRIARGNREIVSQLAKRHVALEQLDDERRKRAAERNLVLMFFKRLLTYPG